MAIKFQFNKTSMNELNKQLKVRVRALPTLKNKESALRVMSKLAKDRAQQLKEDIDKMIDKLKNPDQSQQQEQQQEEQQQNGGGGGGFSNKENKQKEKLDDNKKNDHLRFNWKTRKNNVSTEVDKGWGLTKTLRADELMNVIGQSSSLASTLVFPYVYLRGAYEKVTYNGSEVTDDGAVVFDRPVTD